MAEEADIKPEVEPLPEPELEPEPIVVEQAGSNLPLILALVALLVWFGFQTFQLVRERGNLISVKGTQDTAIQESQKVQTQFQSILTKLSDLANQGHEGAKLVMEQLQRQGLSVGAESRPESKAETKPEAKPAK